ncbi:transposon TX1 putative protein, partial [Trifolium medium]|nr:transposon TX1 putative protein [Trifolium medium]
EDNGELTAPFSLSKIEGVVKASDGSKCLGPYGFIFTFFKEFWVLMKVGVRIVFDQFYGCASLLRSVFSYFLTLIPKVKVPQSLGDFRLIFLLGCLYKLVSEVLVGRLAKVIRSGVYLGDGVLVLNEVIDITKSGETMMENLWVLKVVLRGFEMASGLKVNFLKSCLLGVNVSGAPEEARLLGE